MELQSRSSLLFAASLVAEFNELFGYQAVGLVEPKQRSQTCRSPFSIISLRPRYRRIMRCHFFLSLLQSDDGTREKGKEELQRSTSVGKKREHCDEERRRSGQLTPRRGYENVVRDFRSLSRSLSLLSSMRFASMIIGGRKRPKRPNYGDCMCPCTVGYQHIWPF